MKILFFIESLRSGGKERRMLELIKGLLCYPDIEIELVLTKKDVHYSDVLDFGIKIHYTIRGSLKKDPKVFFQFYKIAQQFKPNIIHVWGNLVAIYAIPAKVFLKIPMINNQITDAPIKVENSLLSHKLTFPFSDQIISNSKAGLKSYNAPKHKSSVIYNGFDFNRINELKNKNLVRQKFEIKSEFVVAMVASFSEKKDYLTFIRVAINILDLRNDVTFLCVGDGNSDYEKEIVGEKHKKGILFLGKQKEVESIMNIVDIGILMSNSRVHGEGISNALLEFMALEKPVIANDAGGTKELINNGKNGFLIKDYDFEDLKNRILLLLDDKSLQKKFGYASKKIVVEKFNLQQMILKFKDSYNELLEINNHL